MNAAPGLIARLQLVVVPCSDHGRSLTFYESLGFERRNDIPFGDGYRWVEVYPRGGAAGIALVSPAQDGPRAVETGIILNTDDIDAAHAQMRSLGADVDAEIARPGAPTSIRIGAVELTGPNPPMFYFRDPDGNALLVVQPG